MPFHGLDEEGLDALVSIVFFEADPLYFAAVDDDVSCDHKALFLKTGNAARTGLEHEADLIALFLEELALGNLLLFFRAIPGVPRPGGIDVGVVRLSLVGPDDNLNGFHYRFLMSGTYLASM